MTNQERLATILSDTTNALSANSKDFVDAYKLEDISYLSDAFQEFADNNTSIYYADQRKYYSEHSSECEDALLELYDADSIAKTIKDEGLDALICKAGALGEYNAIYSELCSDEDEIRKCLAVQSLLDSGEDDIDGLTPEELDELIDSKADEIR